MKVFVTGATGTLGRPTVRQLVAEGHEVRALARTEKNEKLLREAGAVTVWADLFDPAALENAVRGCDAILHLATKIPPLKEASGHDVWLENDRLRAEGTRRLADAALAAGVLTLVYPGVCFFYPDSGNEWIENAEPSEPPRLLLSSIAAEAEVKRFRASGGRGIVLRMGAFYSPTASNTQDTIALARRGIALIFGRSEAYLSQIWVDDAASAIVAAAARAPGGVYDVVDDEPLTRGELVSLMARAVGRRRLFRPPLWLIRLLAGKDVLCAARSQRVSNRQFKEAAGWVPAVPDARQGWGRIAAAL